jgi:hypothetical protein
MEICLSLFIVIRSFPTNGHCVITTIRVNRYAHKKQLPDMKHKLFILVSDRFSTVWVHRKQISLAVSTYVYVRSQLFLMPYNRFPRREHRNNGNL